MKKSKSIFLIMAVIYFAVAILGGVGYLTISENILLGLSLSALLSSISDISYNIGWKKIATNEFGYIVRVTLDFLSEKKAHNANMYNPNINIRGVTQCVEGMSKNYKNSLHPTEYGKNLYIKAMEVLSQICFILSIAAFILLPFLPTIFQSSISTLLTLGAFAAMCFNQYITEAITDILNKRNDDFMNKEQVIIQTAYPDFSNFLNEKLWFDTESAAVEETQEEVEPDAHA